MVSSGVLKTPPWRGRCKRKRRGGERRAEKRAEHQPSCPPDTHFVSPWKECRVEAAAYWRKQIIIVSDKKILTKHLQKLFVRTF